MAIDRIRQDVCSLSEGAATLTFPDPLSPADFEIFRDWLHLILNRSARETVRQILRPSAEGAAVQPSAAPEAQSPPPGSNCPGASAEQDPLAAPSAEGREE